MIFTQEQIDEIKQRLSLRGIKDSELDKLDLLEHPLTGKEVITIVKDGENLRISVEDLYEEFTKYIEQSGIFNVSTYLGRLDPEFENAAKPCTLREAVNASPPYIRKAGQMISFLDSYNMKWKTYQYIGTKDDDWENIDLFEADVTVLQDRVDNLNSTVSNLQPEVQSAKTTAEEAKQIALGANRSITFGTYEEMVHILEGGSGVFEFTYGAKAKVGQNIYIAALNVPDCWIAEVDEEGRLTSSEYDTESPTFDNDIVNLLVSENGLIINNWIRLRALETQKVDLTEYDKDISNLKQNVASNTSEIGTINTKFVAIEQDVQNNQSSILRLDEEKATRQELQNSAQGLGQAISSIGALAGSNNSKINALQESVTTNSNDISELKEGKANYTDIVDGTIVAAHALLADNAASAENAKNAKFAAEAGKATQSDTAKLATAAQTAYNVKATNIEGTLTKEQLPVITQTVHIPITNSGLSPTGYSGSTTLQETGGGNSLYVSIPVYITAPAIINELSGVSNIFIIARCSSDTINAGDTIEIIKNSISTTDRETEIIESGYYCFGYSVTDNNYDVTISRQVSILDLKQDNLVSGENIKTINGKSLLGGGNIEITGGSGGGLSDSDRETINNLIELYEYTRLQAESNDFDTLPLLCGQPMILFGKGTPSASVVPDNWKQYDIETGEHYNWNGLPSALGQQYINTSVTSGGRYIAVYIGYCALKWVNF